MERMWDHWMGEMVLSFHLLGKQTPANQREKLKRQQPVSNSSDSREHLTVSRLQGAHLMELCPGDAIHMHSR